jgi:hypothetical protein
MTGSIKLNASIRRLVSFFISKYRSCDETLRGIFYGMTVHEIDLELKSRKSEVDNLFMLIVFGDLVGLPMLPPYYSVRLLPYIIPNLETWRRRVLRERDLTDRVSMDL